MTKVSKANMEQGKILWVDDEIASFKPHVMVLEGKGYHVTTASSGAEAIELMDGQPFDCILLDEHMPGQTGLDCLPIMHRKAPNVPIIMITKSEEDGV
ncbi:MAG: response regulator, partial [Flavobacteriales bacterium]|nr:response regulator [Flavobacteriales bacterium]